MGFAEQGNGRRVRPGINVTPLVDVVLVLLIIFMVVTPLLMKRFPVRVPEKVEAPSPAEDAAPPAVVALDASGALTLNREAIDDATLEARLRQLFANRHERVLFVAVADQVPYGRAVEVMDRARGGGADPLVLMTEAAGVEDAP